MEHVGSQEALYYLYHLAHWVPLLQHCTEKPSLAPPQGHVKVLAWIRASPLRTAGWAYKNCSPQTGAGCGCLHQRCNCVAQVDAMEVDPHFLLLSQASINLTPKSTAQHSNKMHLILKIQ